MFLKGFLFLQRLGSIFIKEIPLSEQRKAFRMTPETLSFPSYWNKSFKTAPKLCVSKHQKPQTGYCVTRQSTEELQMVPVMSTVMHQSLREMGAAPPHWVHSRAQNGFPRSEPLRALRRVCFFPQRAGTAPSGLDSHTPPPRLCFDRGCPLRSICCALSEAEVPCTERCVTEAQREGGIGFHSSLQALIFTSFLEALLLSFHPESTAHFTGWGGGADDGFAERSLTRTHRACEGGFVGRKREAGYLHCLRSAEEEFLRHPCAPGHMMGIISQRLYLMVEYSNRIPRQRG